MICFHDLNVCLGILFEKCIMYNVRLDISTTHGEKHFQNLSSVFIADKHLSKVPRRKGFEYKRDREQSIEKTSFLWHAKFRENISKECTNMINCKQKLIIHYLQNIAHVPSFMKRATNNYFLLCVFE